MKGYIYRIVNTKTKHTYIGSTVQTLNNRFKAHRSNARIGKPGRLYDHIRSIGEEHFSIEAVEEFDVESMEELGLKEMTHFCELSPSLNMKAPNVVTTRECGRIYRVVYISDTSQFYVGSTLKESLDSRLSDHRSSSSNGETKFYTFMREHGRDNFTIECIEEDVPTDQLITRENHWIQTLQPPLNTNIHLCITDKERDRLKYQKNREQRIQQVNSRLQTKRAEINAQKKMHYHANKERIQAKYKEDRDALKLLPLFDSHPGWTREVLTGLSMMHLQSMARRLGWTNHVPIHKPKLIDALLQRQDTQFGGTCDQQNVL